MVTEPHLYVKAACRGGVVVVVVVVLDVVDVAVVVVVVVVRTRH